jgi:hypothetical protein
MKIAPVILLLVAGLMLVVLTGCLLDGQSGSSLEPPKAPSNLSADSVAYDKVDLSWTDNSSNEDVFGIYRRTSSASEYTLILRPGRNSESCSDEDVYGNTTYYYYVRASNNAGKSEPSNEVMVHTPTYNAWDDLLFGGSSGDGGLLNSCGCLGIEPLILILLILLLKRSWSRLFSKRCSSA